MDRSSLAAQNSSLRILHSGAAGSVSLTGMQGSPKTTLSLVLYLLLPLFIIVLHGDACTYSLIVNVFSVTLPYYINPQSLISLFIFALTFHENVLANFPSFGGSWLDPHSS